MNTKMKVLSLVLGTAFAGSAAAVCPTSPVPPWTSVNEFQGGTAAIVDGGLAGTECRLDSSLDGTAGGFSTAQVQDDSPATEPRYRAQFMINVDALTSPTLTTTASVFTAGSDATGIGANFAIFGNGGQWFISYVAPNADDPSGFSSGSIALAAGENHVEFDLQIGATGSFSMWVNNNDEGNPDIDGVALNNAAVVGVDSAYLGLAAPSVAFVNNYAGVAAGFDQFDSRRSTFIGF